MLTRRSADVHAGVPDAVVPVPDEADVPDEAELVLATDAEALGPDPVALADAAGGAADEADDNAEQPAVRTPAASSGTASNLFFTRSPTMNR